MLPRAVGLGRIWYLLGERAEGVDQGADHDDLGAAWMVVLYVRLGLTRTDTSGERCDEDEEDAKHSSNSRLMSGPPNESRVSCVA